MELLRRPPAMYSEEDSGAVSPRKLFLGKEKSFAAVSPRKLSLGREKSFAAEGKKQDQQQQEQQQQQQQQQQKQGAKPVEVYGFVGSISSMAAFAMFVVWAYIPDRWLHSVGITYYPDKYWAVATPAFLLLTIPFVLAGYMSLNYMATPSPESFDTLFDEHSREPAVTAMFWSSPCSASAEATIIHPIADLPLVHVNQVMFNAGA